MSYNGDDRQWARNELEQCSYNQAIGVTPHTYIDNVHVDNGIQPSSRQLLNIVYA